MNEIFKSLKLLTRGWVIALIAAYDDSDKIKLLLKKHIGEYLDFHFLQTKTDSGFIAIYEDVVWVGICGTRNLSAWLTNIFVWRKDGFHAGIASGTEKLFTNYWRDLLRHTSRPIKIAGQSRGDSASLYLNKLLREVGCRDVESFGWAGPYIAGSKGMDQLKRLGVRHTHFFSDPSGPLPSDPTDDIGCIRGKHYGYKINLGGFGGPFDHGYKSITTRMVILYILWTFKDKKWSRDAGYLSNTGMEIAKK